MKTKHLKNRALSLILAFSMVSGLFVNMGAKNAVSAATEYNLSSDNISITSAGEYNITSTESTEHTISVAANLGSEDEPVKITLNGITRSVSGDTATTTAAPAISVGKDSYVEFIIEGTNNIDANGQVILLDSDTKYLKLSGTGTLNATVNKGPWSVIGSSIENSYNAQGNPLKANIVVDGDGEFTLNLTSGKGVISGNNEEDTGGGTGIGSTSSSSSGSILVKGGMIVYTNPSEGEFVEKSGGLSMLKGTDDVQVYIDGGSINSTVYQVKTPIYRNKTTGEIISDDDYFENYYGNDNYEEVLEALGTIKNSHGDEISMVEASGLPESSPIKILDQYSAESEAKTDSDGKAYIWLPKTASVFYIYATGGGDAAGLYMSGTISDGATTMAKDSTAADDDCTKTGEFSGVEKHLELTLVGWDSDSETDSSNPSYTNTSLGDNGNAAGNPLKVTIPTSEDGLASYTVSSSFVPRSTCNYPYHAVKSTAYTLEDVNGGTAVSSGVAYLTDNEVFFKNGADGTVKLTITSTVSNGGTTYDVSRELYFSTEESSEDGIDLSKVESNADPYLLITDEAYYIGSTRKAFGEKTESIRLYNSKGTTLEKTKIYITSSDSSKEINILLDNVEFDASNATSASVSPTSVNFEKTHSLLSVYGGATVNLSLRGDSTLSSSLATENLANDAWNAAAPTIEVRKGSTLNIQTASDDSDATLTVKGMLYGVGIGALIPDSDKNIAGTEVRKETRTQKYKTELVNDETKPIKDSNNVEPNTEGWIPTYEKKEVSVEDGYTYSVSWDSNSADSSAMGKAELKSGVLNIDAQRYTAPTSTAPNWILWAIGTPNPVQGTAYAAASGNLITEPPASDTAPNFIMSGGRLKILQRPDSAYATAMKSTPYAINVPASIAPGSEIESTSPFVFQYANKNTEGYYKDGDEWKRMALVPVAVDGITGAQEISYQLTLGTTASEGSALSGHTNSQGIFFIYLPEGLSTRIHATVPKENGTSYNRRMTPSTTAGWGNYGDNPWTETTSEECYATKNENYTLLLANQEGKVKALTIKKKGESAAEDTEIRYVASINEGDDATNENTIDIRFAPGVDASAVLLDIDYDAAYYKLVYQNKTNASDKTEYDKDALVTERKVVDLSPSKLSSYTVKIDLYGYDDNVSKTYILSSSQLPNAVETLSEGGEDTSTWTVVDVSMGDVVLRNPAGVTDTSDIGHSALMQGNGGDIELIEGTKGFMVTGETDKYRVYVGSHAGNVAIKDLYIDHSETNPLAEGYPSYAKDYWALIARSGSALGLASAYTTGCLVLDWTDYQNAMVDNSNGSNLAVPAYTDPTTQEKTVLRIEGTNKLIGPSSAAAGRNPGGLDNAFESTLSSNNLYDFNPTDNSYLDGALVLMRDTVAQLTGSGRLDVLSNSSVVTGKYRIVSPDTTANTWEILSIAESGPQVFFGKPSDLTRESGLQGVESFTKDTWVQFLSEPVHDTNTSTAPSAQGALILHIDSAIQPDSESGGNSGSEGGEGSGSAAEKKITIYDATAGKEKTYTDFVLDDKGNTILWLEPGYHELRYREGEGENASTYYARVFTSAAPAYSNVSMAKPEVTSLDAPSVGNYKGGTTTLTLKGHNLGGVITAVVTADSDNAALWRLSDDGESQVNVGPIVLTEQAFNEGDEIETWTCEIALPKNEQTVPKYWNIQLLMNGSEISNVERDSEGNVIKDSDGKVTSGAQTYVSQKLAIITYELPKVNTGDSDLRTVQIGTLTEDDFVREEGKESFKIKLAYDTTQDMLRNIQPKYTINSITGYEGVRPVTGSSQVVNVDGTTEYRLFSTFDDANYNRNAIVYTLTTEREPAPTLSTVVGGSTANWNGGSAEVKVSGFSESWSSFEHAASDLGRKIVVEVYDPSDTSKVISTGEQIITDGSSDDAWKSVSTYTITLKDIPGNPARSWKATEYPIKVFINGVEQAAGHGQTITVPARPSSEMENDNYMKSFAIAGLPEATIEEKDDHGEINITVEHGRVISSFTPTIVLSGQHATWATSDGETENINFGAPVDIIVTAENGGKRVYTVSINNDLNPNARLGSFRILKQIGNSVIDHDAKTVTVRMPYSAGISRIRTNQITATAEAAADGARVAPRTNSSTLNFNNAVYYRVTAASGAVSDYRIIVNKDPQPSVSGVTITYPTPWTNKASYATSTAKPVTVTLNVQNLSSFYASTLEEGEKKITVIVSRADGTGDPMSITRTMKEGSDLNFRFNINALPSGTYMPLDYYVQVQINGMPQLGDDATSLAERTITVPAEQSSNAGITGFHILNVKAANGKTISQDPVKGTVLSSGASAAITNVHVYLPKNTDPETLKNLVIGRSSFGLEDTMRGTIDPDPDTYAFTYLDETAAPEFARTYHTQRFKITSEDGRNVQYFDLDFEIILDTEATMEKFVIPKQITAENAGLSKTGTGGNINILMPYETHLDTLVPTITYTGYRAMLSSLDSTAQRILNTAGAQPYRQESTLAMQNFASSAVSPVVYTVAAEDKSIETFRAVITKDPTPTIESVEIIYPDDWDWHGGDITIRLKDTSNFYSFYRNTLSDASKMITMRVTGNGPSGETEFHENADYSETVVLKATDVAQGGNYDFKYTIPSNVQYTYQDWTYNIELWISTEAGGLGRMEQKNLAVYERYESYSPSEAGLVADGKIFVPREVSDNVAVLDFDLPNLKQMELEDGSKKATNFAGNNWATVKDGAALAIKRQEIDEHTTLFTLTMPIATKQAEIQAIAPGEDAVVLRRTGNSRGKSVLLFRGQIVLYLEDENNSIAHESTDMGEFGKPYIDILNTEVDFRRGRVATYRFIAEDGETYHDYQVKLEIRKDHDADMGTTVLHGKEYTWSDAATYAVADKDYVATVDNSYETMVIDQLPFYYIPVPDSFTGTVYDKEGEASEETVKIHWLGEKPQETLLDTLPLEFTLASKNQLAYGIKRAEVEGYAADDMLKDDKAETGYHPDTNPVLVHYYDTQNFVNQFNTKNNKNAAAWLTQEYTVVPEITETGGVTRGLKDVDYELQIHSIEVLQKSTEIINPKYEEQRRDPEIGIWPEEFETSEDVKPMVTAGDDIMKDAPEAVKAYRWIKFYVSSGTDLEHISPELYVPEGSGEKIVYVEKVYDEETEELLSATLHEYDSHKYYEGDPQARNFSESRDKPLEYIVVAEDGRVHERWMVSFIKLSSGDPPKPGNQTNTTTETTGGNAGYIGGGGGGAAGEETAEDGQQSSSHSGNADDIETGYVSGIRTEDGSYVFQPTRAMRRAETASLLMQLLATEGLVPDNDGELESILAGYSDINPNEWYAKAVAYMTELGVFEGNKHGDFEPASDITRMQFAATLVRMIDEGYVTPAVKAGEPTSFSDIENRWGEEAIVRLSSLGVINGYPNGTFRPDNIVTRAEAIAMINRLTGRTADEEVLEKLKEEGIVFDDMSENYWAYNDVLVASNSWEVETITTTTTWTGRRVGSGNKEVTEETTTVEVVIHVLSRRESAA